MVKNYILIISLSIDNKFYVLMNGSYYNSYKFRNWDFIKIAFYIAQILLWYTSVIGKADAWYIRDIALISWKWYLLTCISPMSMQYLNPISETWYIAALYLYTSLKILLWYTKGLLRNLMHDIFRDIALISWKGYLLTYISPMSMQYPNDISENWYCGDIPFNIAQILLWYTKGLLRNLMHDITLISLLYHEKDIPYIYPPYVNAISKSYIRNLILL